MNRELIYTVKLGRNVLEEHHYWMDAYEAVRELRHQGTDAEVSHIWRDRSPS